MATYLLFAGLGRSTIASIWLTTFTMQFKELTLNAFNLTEAGFIHDTLANELNMKKHLTNQ